MRANLSELFKLQTVDQELQSIEDTKGDLPQQVERLKNEISELKQDCESQKVELKETKKQLALNENELNSFQDKLKQLKEKLYAVTSNKEYDAITTEIDTMQEKISEAEDNTLEMIEKEETLTSAVGELEPKIVLLEEGLIQKTEELNKKITASEKEYEDFKKQRDEISAKIKRPVLYQYERIRKGLGNSAVANITAYACSGCFTTIPAQKTVEIRSMSELILCESCGRILVHINGKEVVSN